MSDNKVLLVTDHAGNLHITPLGNKAYYQSQNVLNKTGAQYKFVEKEETEAEAFVKKHAGRDPQFIKPNEAAKILSEKDQVIASKDEQIAKLQSQINSLNNKGAASQNTAGADDNAGAGGGAAKPSKPPKPPKPAKVKDEGNAPDPHAELIAKINASESVEEINTLIVDNTELTVLEAANNRIEVLNLK